MAEIKLHALIDPHVHFRTPGAEHKETWETAARAAIKGGVTTVLDMPNNTPACTNVKQLYKKKALIDEALGQVGIPLRYGLYLGAESEHLDQIEVARGEIAALKIYMGSSTGGLTMCDRESLAEAFRLAAKNNVLVVVHAEDEALIAERTRRYFDPNNPACHSQIRSPEVAMRAVAEAIGMAQTSGARLYIAHVSTEGELNLIRKAKSEGLPIYAEATPHHLFLDDTFYAKLGSFALVNPPLRSRRDQAALWHGIEDGTIDTIGTDHAPHTRAEKAMPYGKAPSGFPSIEVYLALLLNAHNQGRISLETIASLTYHNPRAIFRLPENDDVVWVDLNRVKTVDPKHLATKAGWTPYDGWSLQGWPRYTVLRGQTFDVEAM
ncbi:MAG: dihydroorotase [Chlamydiota bacterium]|jgi:dihydroorotase